MGKEGVGSVSCRPLRLPAWADCRHVIGEYLSRCLEQLYRQLLVKSGRAGMEAHVSRGRPAFSTRTFKTYLVKIPSTCLGVILFF